MKSPGETVTVTAPTIRFDEPEDVHPVVIPDGCAAVVFKEGERPVRIDLAPGEHTLSGTCMDEIDAPFVVVVLERKYADVCARSRSKVGDLSVRALDA